jgi:hypothetical protein
MAQQVTYIAFYQNAIARAIVFLPDIAFNSIAVDAVILAAMLWLVNVICRCRNDNFVITAGY